MKFILSLIALVCIFTSCQDYNNKQAYHTPVEIADTGAVKPVEVDSSNTKFDTSKMSMEERLNKLIEISTLKKFNTSRDELVIQGSQYNYQITDIKKIGNSYTYKATIPGANVEMDYSCIPVKGEYSVYMAGETEAIQSQYNQLKVQQDWDNCHKVEEGERCESAKKIEAYPIKTLFKISISYTGANHAILNFKRILKPDN